MEPDDSRSRRIRPGAPYVPPDRSRLHHPLSALLRLALRPEWTPPDDGGDCKLGLVMARLLSDEEYPLPDVPPVELRAVLGMVEKCP